jgi:hypothetical protein
MTAQAQVPDARFSAAALEQLSRALQLYLATWDEVRHETLRLALERLCTEAHALQLGPEKMLVAVKEAWARVSGIHPIDSDRARVAFERVVGYCIDAYYAPRSADMPSAPST